MEIIKLKKIHIPTRFDFGQFRNLKELELKKCDNDSDDFDIDWICLSSHSQLQRIVLHNAHLHVYEDEFEYSQLLRSAFEPIILLHSRIYTV